MRRVLVYVLLLGALTGLVLGVALFGLPLPAEDVAPAPGPFAALIIERGLSLADAAVALGGLALALVLVAALVDLRRAAGARRA